MRLIKFLGILIAAIVLAKIFVFPDYLHRFRLTIEFDTPDGVKSASGVHEVVRKNPIIIPFLPGDRVSYRFRGEAIFLDLGRGKHVIALLAHGQRADNVDLMHTLGIQAHAGFANRFSADAWSGRMSGVLTLPEYLIPTMVTFADLSDPKTARVVLASSYRTTHGGPKPDMPAIYVDDVAAALGPGYAFRRMTIENVRAGIWPLDDLGIYGQPITQRIVDRVAFLTTHHKRLWTQRTSPSDSYRPQYGQFIRSKP